MAAIALMDDCVATGAHQQKLPSTQISFLEQKARDLCAHTVRMVHQAKSSHLGTCFSMADIIACLYWETLRIDPTRPAWPDRDRFILSKGHGAALIYAALAERGFFPLHELESYCQSGSRLTGHITSGVPGVELSSGSLGHGLPVGCGLALADKREGNPSRTFVLASDGELDEGSNWEAILFAPQHCLDNLTLIIDYNKIQACGNTKDIIDLHPLAEKFHAFRWAVQEIDGHDMEQIVAAFAAVPFQAGKPNVVIAHTTKGRGVSFMEDSVSWHYNSPSKEQMQSALLEIQGTK
jgi:transketolase